METVCPYCDYVATDHESLSGGGDPNDGGISFCISCGEVSEFYNGELRKVDVNTLDDSTKREIKDIETAWIKTRAISKISKRNPK